MSGKIFSCLLLTGVLTTSTMCFTSSVLAEDPLADRAYKVLEARCSQCHGEGVAFGDLDILDYKQLTGDRPGKRFINAEKTTDLSASRVWETIESEFMPVKTAEEMEHFPLSEEEKTTLKEWIEAGAPEWFPGDNREFISRLNVLTWIEDDLRTIRRRGNDDIYYTKYLSIVPQHNNSKYSEFDLKLYRAAMSKAINSVSRSGSLYVPEALPDSNNTIYRIDIRNYEWDETDWTTILKQYPYATEPDRRQHDEEYMLYGDIVRLLNKHENNYTKYENYQQGHVPFVRVDWFIVAVTRDPLYHDLLNIPDTLHELEEDLELFRMQKIKENKLIRGGVLKSGISGQNRIMDRFDTFRRGYYWISYDFVSDAQSGDIILRPLGPGATAASHLDPLQQNYPDYYFKHDGNEIIFQLANGLQGYMLVDGEGKRIDEGAPTSIVADKTESSGTVEIVNGISCIACHKHGIIPFTDIVRGLEAIGNNSVDTKIKTIYRSNDPQVRDSLGFWLKQDQETQIQKLHRLIDEFFGDLTEQEFKSLPEPVSYVAKRYYRDLTFDDIGFELGLPREEHIFLRFARDNELLKLGLAIVDPNSKIKNVERVYPRAKWDSITASLRPYNDNGTVRYQARTGPSKYQQTMKELNRGTAIINP